MHDVMLIDGPLSYADVSKAMETCPCCGAVLWFAGNVRNTNLGEAVDGITYECHKPMAEKELRAIVDEARARWPVHQVIVAHGVGYLGLGETSLLIGVTAPHRRDAYDAQQFMINALKQRVPIWKKEHYVANEPQWLTG